ncbi:MAG: AEC family transporter [bacterium]
MNFISIFFTVFISILKIFIIIILGFFFVRKKIISKSATKDLTNYVINLSLPCLLFTLLVEELNKDLFAQSLIFLLGAFIIIATGIGLGMLVCFLFKIKNPEKNLISCLCGFGNASYLPIPLIATIIPDSGLFVNASLQFKKAMIYLSFYLIVWNFLQWSLGKWLIANSSSTKKKFKISFFFNIPTIGIFLGIIVSMLGWKKIFLDNYFIKKTIFDALKFIGNTTIPIVMFTLGGLLANVNFKNVNFKNILLVMSIKLLIFPILGLSFFLWQKDINSLIKFILFLECIVPPAIALSMISKQHETNYEFISSTTLILYLLSIIFIPFWLSCFFKLCWN